MPEGHSIHRIARQFARHFVGDTVAASSPQGRFAAGAAEIDGHEMTDARAVGKQMFLEFSGDRWLRVHLGMYGAWDFAGDIEVGQSASVNDSAGENSLASMGAPRMLRMSEQERLGPAVENFPPEPVGAVRVRLLTAKAVADLRGPTACEVLQPEQVQTAIVKLGPDPMVDDLDEGEERFVAVARKKPTPIGLLLMDQSVVSGIGNVYRAELLFRQRLNPHTPGRQVPEDTLRALWRDWVHLLRIGVETGQMMTMDDLDAESYSAALANRDDRHWVYRRAGKPCRICGAPIAMEEVGSRKLYYCPKDQA